MSKNKSNKQIGTNYQRWTVIKISEQTLIPTNFLCSLHFFERAVPFPLRFTSATTDGLRNHFFNAVPDLGRRPKDHARPCKNWS